MVEPDTVAVIMAGGSGTRFWPVSTVSRPKQYLALTDDRSLIQHAVDRLSSIVSEDRIFVCAHESHEGLLREQFGKRLQWFLEPVGKNTAPCLMYSVAKLEMLGIGDSTVMIAVPADHFIRDVDRFRSYLLKASRYCGSHSVLGTLGIIPTSAHTGYGYIEAGKLMSDGVFEAKHFFEKPSAEKAEEFVQSRRFFWNSGMFVWKLSAIRDAFAAHAPSAWHTIRTGVESNKLKEAYSKISAQPIDTAVMEKAGNVVVTPAESIGWTDLGSWGALYELEAQRTGATNIIQSGNAALVDSEGCLVRVESKKQIGLVGVKNIMVVEDGDKLLIVARDKDQLVRSVAVELEK
jgi:mannose-1-phosphate guanylyltransferase